MVVLLSFRIDAKVLALIGGTAAVCDGAEHRWTNSEKRTSDTLEPGAALLQGGSVLFRRSGR